MSLGAGTSAAGTSNAGLGDLDLSPQPYFAVLVDGTINGKQQNARRIDPRAKQYVLDSTGTLQGMPGVQQQVQLALSTVLNSSAIPGFGLQPFSTVVTSNTVKQITAAVNQALSYLVSQKMVIVNGVDIVRPSTTQVDVFVRWTDTTSTGTGAQQFQQQINL